MTRPPLPPNPDPVLNVPLTEELIRRHGLLDEEMARIRELLGREPTLTELGIFSVMWSEHCSYKNSKPLLRLFPLEKAETGDGPGRILVKAGEENAGVIDIGGGWAVAFKIESHNHPSAVEPFEGAATGVGGIIRDIFTMGARPILVTNSLRFGELDDPTVKRLFRGVVAGIAHYGNCIGLPNLGGDVYFDDSYEGNPLVNALCLGVLRHDEIKRGAASGVGNPVYYVGAATGRDGLGGASFASRELSEESQADRPAVQKGDPFMEKLLLEACLEMMAVPGLVVGIQDMGAAGLTCSACETAARGGAGIEIELDQVPQRETGMNSYEIMLSESQERMLVIVQKGREAEVEAIFEKWDLHAAHVGQVTDTGRMVVLQGGSPVADIPARGLTDEAPVYQRETRRPAYLDEVQRWDPASLPAPAAADLETALPKLLGHPTIASKAWVYRQYDHMVRASTVVAPGSDAGVVRIDCGEAGDRYLAVVNDGNGRYCALNPRRGGQIVVAEAMRNLVCTGARPLAVTDNLNFGNPYKPEVFYLMAEAVAGMAEACRAFDTPVTGGNVSLYNESPRGAIDPTPVVGAVGLLEDPAHLTPSHAGRAGLTLVLIGGFPFELGGSQYLKIIHGLKTGDAPSIDLEIEKTQNTFLLDRIAAGDVAAAHDLSEGGLLVAAAEMVFGADGVGVSLDLTAADGPRADALLYGESQGRILLATTPEKTAGLIQAAAAAGVSAQVIGETTGDGRLEVRLPGGSKGLGWSVDELHRAWSGAIEQAMHRPGIRS
ncbi:MAG: phosphoribosylformylglycinamidine synthase subunit PurL [Puniceicoccaceae bacterium]|nr:MAG: phosphoribosylformylglycinamidine synthase subunit PurL [Puniceicoccaceae bacterium]